MERVARSVGDLYRNYLCRSTALYTMGYAHERRVTARRARMHHGPHRASGRAGCRNSAAQRPRGKIFLALSITDIVPRRRARDEQSRRGNGSMTDERRSIQRRRDCKLWITRREHEVK